MSHEAITSYLRDHTAALDNNGFIPNMHGRLTPNEAARVTRFLTFAHPQSPGIGGIAMSRTLEAPIIQGGEQ